MELKPLILDIARGAGTIVREHFSLEKKWRIKTGISDIVTEVDEMSERHIIGRLKDERPGDAVLSEESGWNGVEGGEYVWIVDPIDGTSNYNIGLPFFCVSIAAVQDGTPVAGAIFDPLREDMFYASAGQGAFLNGEPVFVSTAEDPRAGLISVSWVRGKSDTKTFVKIIGELSEHTSQFRRFGSAALALAYVAAGKLNGFIQSGLNPWDAAAADIILREAGAKVTDFTRAPLNMKNSHIEIIAGNPFFHNLLIETLHTVSSE